jgi:hypothetical protein
MKSLIFTFYFSIITLNLFGDRGDPKTPKEFYKGQLKESKNFEHPISMFNKNRSSHFNWKNDVEILFNELVKYDQHLYSKLFETSLAFQMYKGLLDEAKGAEPATCVHNVDECWHPKWVKANALIYLIGVNIVVSNGMMNVTEMNNTQKEVYGKNAINGLEKLNYKIPPCWGGGKIVIM